MILRTNNTKRNGGTRKWPINIKKNRRLCLDLLGWLQTQV